MTNVTLYARAAVFICCLVGGSREATGQDVPRTPCAACIAITILPGQVLLLPDDLHGVTVLLRAGDNWRRELLPAITEVVSRGGRAAVLSTPVAGGAASDRTYRLKLLLTDLRGAVLPDVVLALDASELSLREAGEVAAYADVLVTKRAAPVTSGSRVWPIVEPATIEAALGASSSAGFERWVLIAPVDAVDARRMLHDLAATAAPPDAFVETVDVRGVRQLTAEEIVARHQAAARRHTSTVTHVISTGGLTLTFEAPGFPAPVTVTSDLTLYVGPGRTEVAQRNVRVNGIAFGSGVPRLPIIEPERVASPPLVMTLSHMYRYQREADATIDGIPCYQVSFEPADPRASLFRGRAWIARDSFAAVRIAATQTRLRGVIVSSEQVDQFREFAPGVWLLARSDVRQLYEGAGHRTPIHRVLSIEHGEVNPLDFDRRLARAYASADVMLRDTAEGYRYLSRRPSTDSPDPTSVVVEVAGRADRVRTIAAGVIIDPNITIPLPFAGLSYVDFNLFGTGAQLNAFFGGSFGQVAFSVPSVAGTRWQLAGRASGIVSSYNDRAFREGREIYAENLRQRPAHAAAWLLRPLTPRLSIRAGYELDYTRLRAARETEPAFGVPADQEAHGVRVALDGQRAGWTASAWWNGARRIGWRPWGHPAEYRPEHSNFQRFGLGVGRSTAWSPQVVTAFDASVMTGRDLDRFSQYTFGTFDNRLRGYPAALVRYDRGGVVRSSIAWSLSSRLRLDGFADAALVRDRGFGRRYRSYTGVGAAIEAPLPRGVLASVEWGYGFRGINADGSFGTHVVRVSGLKVF